MSSKPIFQQAAVAIERGLLFKQAVGAVASALAIIYLAGAELSLVPLLLPAGVLSAYLYFNGDSYSSASYRLEAVSAAIFGALMFISDGSVLDIALSGAIGAAGVRAMKMWSGM